MKNFYLIPNTDKPEAVRFSLLVQKYIEEHGGQAVNASHRMMNGHVDPDDVPAEMECVITLGGDGTIIQAARDLARLQLPIIGINLGTLGFMAEVSTEQYENALDVLMNDRHLVDERMMLRGRIYRNHELIYDGLALNDITLHASGEFRAVKYELLVNDEHLARYFADGIVISTPTGSTGYNLSAGGPIVMPSAELITATAVNPHTMLRRSIVLPDNVRVTLKLVEREDQTANVYLDGSVYKNFRLGDEIMVEKAAQKVKFIKLAKDSFIEVLRTKLEN